MYPHYGWDGLTVSRDPHVDLVPLVLGQEWEFNAGGVWRLPNGHGEEVVRSIFLDEKVLTIFLTSFLQA